MNENITLSVVVLSYNNEQYIYDCLSSIENQGIDSYEVFIVDDSSTDNSVEKINEYIKGKPQFHLIEKPNSGGAISSQIGIAKATGKYLALVDSDDVVADGAYKELIRRVEEDGSDFAAGLPMRKVNGFMNTFLISQEEMNVFVENRVLSTTEELESFTKQVFYWNAVYKTDFLKSNQIEMPGNLLIADRIFVYKAVMNAKKISISNKVVYYWRKKENSEKISITDQTAEFHMISDRCDSFQAQIKITLDNFEKHIELNKDIWENSVSRLYYPLKQIASEEAEDKTFEDFEEACERYRCFLLQYKGFFLHLIANSEMKVASKYITERILTKKYKDLYDYYYEEKTFADLDITDIDEFVYNAILRNTNKLSVREINEDNGRIYVNFQILVGIEKDEGFAIDEVFAFNRYFNQKRIDLKYDAKERRADITDLSPATYVLNTVCNDCGEKIYYVPKLAEEYGRVKTVVIGEKVITFNSRYSILTIQKKNRFTLLRDGDDYLLGNNEEDEVKSLFFFNVNDNERTPLEKKGDLYVISPKNLPKGDNVLLYQIKEGLYSTVRKREISNGMKDQDMFDELITRGKIEIEVDMD